MDLRALESFLAVAREGQMTRAAGVMGRTQPALSGQLARLESEIGTTLFHRTPKGMELTEATVDENDVGVKLVTRTGIPISPTHDFANRHVVIVVDRAHLVSTVPVLEGPPVDEADLRADGLVTLQVRDVDRFERADRLLDLERALQ